MGRQPTANNVACPHQNTCKKKGPAAQHQAAQKSRTRAEPTTNNSSLNSTAPGEEEQEHPTRPAISVPMTRFTDSSPSHPATHSNAPRRPPPRRARSEGGEADHQEEVHQGSADEEDEIATEENKSACAGTQWRGAGGDAEPQGPTSCKHPPR